MPTATKSRRAPVTALTVELPEGWSVVEGFDFLDRRAFAILVPDVAAQDVAHDVYVDGMCFCFENIRIPRVTINGEPFLVEGGAT